MSSPPAPLGRLGMMPAEIVRHVCQTLSISDLFNLRLADPFYLGLVVDKTVFPDMHRLKVTLNGDDTAIFEFTRKSSMLASVCRTTTSNDDWRDAVRLSRNIKHLEIDVAKDASSSRVFHAFGTADIRLKSMRLKIRDGSSRASERVQRLHKNITSLVACHSSTLVHLEASTSSGHTVNAEIDDDTLVLDYEHTHTAPEVDQLQTHALAYNMFHAVLAKRKCSKVTLNIESKGNVSIGLQRAFQIAMPYGNRRNLSELTIVFGSAVQQVAEEEVQKLILAHMEEFHYTTPNLQHFICSLPHSFISLEMLQNAIQDQIQQSRPYKSSIQQRPVHCK
ncbi:unnamed protein product [Caenorhabditis bovis]|uniref:F-box domain-containing protein n=1 Tax=Caenorhabditis bovis TaxID=2654633 RepID=A0A8S1F2V8_9PELO|nr:unnamed protein product [Caenorhabditis bovis]